MKLKKTATIVLCLLCLFVGIGLAQLKGNKPFQITQGQWLALRLEIQWLQSRDMMSEENKKHISLTSCQFNETTDTIVMSFSIDDKMPEDIKSKFETLYQQTFENYLDIENRSYGITNLCKLKVKIEYRRGDAKPPHNTKE